MRDLVQMLADPEGGDGTEEHEPYPCYHSSPARLDRIVMRDVRAPSLVNRMAMERVTAALTPDLLREPYRSRVAAGAHPLTGHCYIASEALYHLLGGKDAGLKAMSIQHEGGPHWWLRTRDGLDLDPTAAQFSAPVPYALGVGRGLLTREPSKRARIVIARVQA